MDFCGLCTTIQKQNEIVFYDSKDKYPTNHLSSRQGQKLFNNIDNIGTMILKSQYQRLYSEAKEKATKFTDSEFPPNDTSLAYRHPTRKIVWKRISEVINNPVMVEGKIQPNDIQQGNIGDCYFLAAISALAEVPIRILNIFWNQMEVKPEGIYRLAVNIQGKRQEIYIDDYIPVFEGSDRPVFCKPMNNEIWVILLEKAWAKLSGSYGMTSEGYSHEVFNTFSLAPCIYTEIQEDLKYRIAEKYILWEKLMEGEKMNLPMCAGSRQKNICKGIKPSHTYSILNCYQIKNQKILKLRNPWGDASFTGQYSFEDKKFWEDVSSSIKKAVFHEGVSQGIFTLSFDQFLYNFQSLDICYDMTSMCQINTSIKYNYQFKTVKASSHQEFFFEVKVCQFSKQPLYVSFEKQFDRQQTAKNKVVDFGYSKILIAKKDENSYEYLDAKLESNFPDLTVQCTNLKKGTYIVYCQTQFLKEKTGTFTFSIYGIPKIQIQIIEKPDPLFLHQVFTHHAFVINKNREYISKSHDDWTISSFSLEAGGFGYVLGHLGNNSSRKMKMSCDIQKVYANGFYVVERATKNKKGEIQIEIVNGEQAILVFATRLTNSLEFITFPPTGLKMLHII